MAPRQTESPDYKYAPQRGSGTFVEIPYSGFDNRNRMNPIAKSQLKAGLVQEQPPSGRNFRPPYPKVDRNVSEDALRTRNEYGVGGQWCVMFTPGHQVPKKNRRVHNNNNNNHKSRDLNLADWDTDSEDNNNNNGRNPRNGPVREDWHQTKIMSDGSKWAGSFWKQKHGILPCRLHRATKPLSCVFTKDCSRSQRFMYGTFIGDVVQLFTLFVGE